MEGFFKLISYFQTQSEPAYCALASLSMVLNALAIDPGRKWKGPWRWFDESMLDCCEPLEKIKAEGITFGKVACLAHCAGAKVEAFHTTQSTLSDFRNHVMKCTSSEDCHLITSYHRKAFKQQVFENHRVVFTVGTSIASVLTAWAGYSLRRLHQTNVENRLGSIEEAMKKKSHIEHEEIKKIVNSGNISTSACIATAWTSLVIGYGLGWRGGAWYANRKFQREQLKLMGKLKPHRWQFLRRPFVRLRNARAVNKPAAELPPMANTQASNSQQIQKVC